MSVKRFEISRRGTLLGLAAGATSTFLPKAARAAGNPQAEAWKSIPLLRHDGTSFALNAVPGRTVVVALWGAFCGVCRAEMPGLLRLQHELGDQALGVVLVSHPLFWEEDYPAAVRMGLADKAATASADTSWDLLSTAWAMQGTSVEVPQTLVYRRANGAELSLVAHQTGGLGSNLIARIREG